VLGLHHPQNSCFDPGGTGMFIIADIGRAHVEKIDFGINGANYGWPLREDTFATNRRDPSILYPLPSDDAARRFTYPVAQHDHVEGRAIAGGFVYRGSGMPAMVGQYIFGDIGNGRVDLCFGQGPSGEVYILTTQDGKIRKLRQS
jgi:hypothetical protein